MKIDQLNLYSTQIDDQWQFYKGILGLPCDRIADQTFRVNTLHTQLEFQHSGPEQYYHFAFLLPTGTMHEAITYLESRGIELLMLDGEKIVHFNPGQAIYFKDPDGNIVEWIERPSVQDGTGLKFDPANLVCVNEIGLPVERPRNTARLLMDRDGIIPENPEGFSDEFCWVGDARGVLIVVKKGRNWLPTDISSVTNHFKIQYRSKGESYHLEIKGDEIEIIG